MLELMNQRPEFPASDDVEGQLYDSFTPDADKPRVQAVRQASPEELADFQPNFVDERLDKLLFRYKARQFPESLSESEKIAWRDYKLQKFQRELPGFMERMAQLAETAADSNQQFVLEEIQLWIEANWPGDES
jgi:exodeoxyribonuclease-1